MIKNYIFSIKSKTLVALVIIILTSVSSFSQVTIMVEAEDANLSGTTEEKFHVNASNGAFVKSFKSDPVGTLSFDVDNVTTAGIYKLEIFHFNLNQLAIEIAVNNGANSTVTLQESNWAYQGSAKSTYIDIALNSGNNTITISTPFDDVLFDKFRVTENFNVYYFSSSAGDDTNDGSLNAPWKTIDKANEVAEKLSNGGLLAPGDKLLFKGGDTFYGHFEVKCSGSVEKPIELSNYGPGEKPKFSGSGGTITGGDWFEAVLLTNTSNLLLTNLWITNDRQDDSRFTYGEYSSFGIKVKANKWGGLSSNLEFRDLKISDVYGISIPPPQDFNQLNATGIRFDSDAFEDDLDVAVSDVLIEDCYFTHIGKAGVWAVHKGTTDDSDDAINRNQNFVIKNNTFYQTGGSGVILSKTHKALVQNNDFDHTGYSSGSEGRLAGRGSGMWVWSCRNVVAQYNRSYSIRGPGDSYGMHMDFNNKNILFQYNYSEDSEGGFCEILGNNYNSTYRFNVSMNDGFRDFHGYTLWVSGYAGSGKPAIRSDENYIYNNTIFLNNSIYTPRISIYALNTYVYNNIFVASNGAKIAYDSTSDPTGKPGVSIDVGSGSFIMENNLFEGDIHTVFKSYGSNSQSGSPLFVNADGTTKEDYIIQNGSPAIDNGKSFPEPSFPLAGIGIFKDISATALTDAFGLAINIENASPNIGASNAHNSENTLSIDAPNKIQNLFKIYPNPVKDDINLEFSKEGKSQEIFIYDIVGKVIYTTNIETTYKNSKISLPQNIKNGIYFLRIIEESKTQTTQFILYR